MLLVLGNMVVCKMLEWVGLWLMGFVVDYLGEVVSLFYEINVV